MKKTILLTVSLLLFFSSSLHAAEPSPPTEDLLDRWRLEDSVKRIKVFDRLQELDSIILLRSGMTLRYASVNNKTKLDVENAKKIYDTTYGAAILSSNIHHIHTMLEFVTAIIAMQETGIEKDNNDLFKASLFVIENYVYNGFQAEFIYIKTGLINCQKFPEPISTIAKDTLRDFEECKALIMSIAPIQSKE